MSILVYPELNEYLLNFLDIRSILRLSIISKETNKLLLSQPFIKDIHKIVQIENIKNFDNEIVDLASKNGHIAVLEWFKNSEYEFKYTDDAIDWAS